MIKKLIYHLFLLFFPVSLMAAGPGVVLSDYTEIIAIKGSDAEVIIRLAMNAGSASDKFRIPLYSVKSNQVELLSISGGLNVRLVSEAENVFLEFFLPRPGRPAVAEVQLLIRNFVSRKGIFPARKSLSTPLFGPCADDKCPLKITHYSVKIFLPVKMRGISGALSDKNGRFHYRLTDQKEGGSILSISAENTGPGHTETLTIALGRDYLPWVFGLIISLLTGLYLFYFSHLMRPGSRPV